jgi:hypothetical protein
LGLLDQSIDLSFPLSELFITAASQSEVLVVIVTLPPNLKRIGAFETTYQHSIKFVQEQNQSELTAITDYWTSMCNVVKEYATLEQQRRRLLPRRPTRTRQTHLLLLQH